MDRRLIRFLVAFSASAVMGAALGAQVSTGSVAGVIADPNNNAIMGYSGGFITMKNTATSAEFRADIKTDGTFLIEGLPAGDYDLSAPITGAMYRAYNRKNVVISAGETLRLRLPIEWGINLGTFGDDPTMLAKDMARSGEGLAGPPPRTRDGKPDLTGVWVPMAVVGAPPNPFPLQPWAVEMQRKLAEVRGPDAQNNGAYCLPSAMLTMTGFPYKFVQAGDVIVQLVEFETPGIRQIFMDGRPHPKPEDWNPAWHGHSIGRWEGDTLVIDNVGFNEITPGFGIHSEKLHVVERIRRTSVNRLEIEITAADAEAFTGTWKTTRYGALAPDHEILEFVCPENNKDMQNFGGLGWKGRP
jgi:hypothetical protein